MRRTIVILTLSVVSLASWGQDWQSSFRHLEVGATAGNVGIGFDVATPLCEGFRLRAGFAFMPHTETAGSNDLYLGGEPATLTTSTEDLALTDHFAKLTELMSSFTGYQMDTQIDFLHEPTMWNGRILVDWEVPRFDGFHVTAGLYLGPSEVSHVCNRDYEMHTLTGMGIYQGIYERALAGKPIITIGTQSVSLPEEYMDKVLGYGALTIPAGTMNDGSVFSFGPGTTGLAEARVRTNWLRPYVGLGYTCQLGPEQRTSLSCDLGLMYWGTPRITTSAGVDMVHDVREVTGELGRWYRSYASKAVKPVIELRVSHRLF